MSSLYDEWHLAAAKVSPLIWDIQKTGDWSSESAKKIFKRSAKLKKIKDYVGILTSEPEIESVRDRLVVYPINYSAEIFQQPFLLERARQIEVFDAEGKSLYKGVPIPEQTGDFLRWCSGHFVRLVGVQPPTIGP